MALEGLLAAEAAEARAALARLDESHVNDALERAARLLRQRRGEILAANEADVAGAQERLDSGALDRLRLDDERIETIAAGLETTAALPSIDREVRSWQLPNGLRVSERLIPIGVVGANFEARPNVAADVASQILKSGNAVVL